MPISQTVDYFEDPLYRFLEESMLSLGFGMKPQRQSVFLCWDKNQAKFCLKSWQPFILCLFDEKFHSNILYSLLMFEMECVYLNWLCKYMKNFSQPCISTNSCTDMSKTLFFPVSIVKGILIHKNSWFIYYNNVSSRIIKSKVRSWISKRYHGDTTVRSRHKKCSVNKGVLKILQTSQQNNLLLLLLLLLLLS